MTDGHLAASKGSIRTVPDATDRGAIGERMRTAAPGRADTSGAIECPTSRRHRTAGQSLGLTPRRPDPTRMWLLPKLECRTSMENGTCECMCVDCTVRIGPAEMWRCICPDCDAAVCGGHGERGFDE